MKYFTSALFAALYTTVSTTASAQGADYAKCRFYDNRNYSGNRRPRVDAELAIKQDIGSSEVTIDFGFERGHKNTDYTLDFYSTENGSVIDERRCNLVNNPTKLTTDLITGTTDRSRDFSRVTATTSTFDVMDIEDGLIYAILSDDTDIVACCELEDLSSKRSYDKIIRNLDRI